MFGLRQAYRYCKNLEYTPAAFTRSGIYTWVRYPVQTGVLIGIWATPDMRLDHLLMRTGLTTYIFIGLWYEQRDLIVSFGEQYRQNRTEVGSLFPQPAKKK